MGTPGAGIILTSGAMGLKANHKGGIFDAGGAGCDCCGCELDLTEANFTDDFSSFSGFTGNHNINFNNWSATPYTPFASVPAARNNGKLILMGGFPYITSVATNVTVAPVPPTKIFGTSTGFLKVEVSFEAPFGAEPHFSTAAPIRWIDRLARLIVRPAVGTVGLLTSGGVRFEVYRIYDRSTGTREYFIQATENAIETGASPPVIVRPENVVRVEQQTYNSGTFRIDIERIDDLSSHIEFFLNGSLWAETDYQLDAGLEAYNVPNDCQQLLVDLQGGYLISQIITPAPIFMPPHPEARFDDFSASTV